jgi:hypothetical protein
MRVLVRGVAIGLLGIGLLFLNVATTLKSAPAPSAARYFADLSMGTFMAIRGEFPVACYEVKRSPVLPQRGPFKEYQAAVTEALRRGSVYGFLRPSPGLERFAAEPGVFVERMDDSGRARLLGYMFRWIGGVSAFLPQWIASLMAVPLLLWLGLEFARAGRSVCGGLFVAGLGSSAYAVDLLMLDYSATGFYLVAILALVALSVWASSRNVGGYPTCFVRALLAGVALAVCGACRSSVAFLVPGLALAFVVAGSKLPEGALVVAYARPRESRSLLRIPAALGAFAIVLTLMLAPWILWARATETLVARTSARYGVESEPQRHDIWLSLWEGLGDFDRTKGHAWLDETARARIEGRQLGTERAERIFREDVLQHVREDPVWYARILVERVFATITQWKLWPWHPLSGLSMRAGLSPNEGAMDTYYRLTATADWFVVAGWRFEMPMPLLLAWPLVVGLAWAFRRQDPRVGSAALALAIVALGILALPVLVTTAGALEAEAFLVVYLLAAGFAGEAAFRDVRDWWRHVAVHARGMRG